MGIGLFRGCFTDRTAPAPNPDPSRWKLLKTVAFKYSTVVMVEYLDCDNFEGRKILVFEHNVGFKLDESKPLDPHFSMRPDAPIARFVPTDKGWDHALEFAKEITFKITMDK